MHKFDAVMPSIQEESVNINPDNGLRSQNHFEQISSLNSNIPTYRTF